MKTVKPFQNLQEIEARLDELTLQQIEQSDELAELLRRPNSISGWLLRWLWPRRRDNEQNSFLHSMKQFPWTLLLPLAIKWAPSILGRRTIFRLLGLGTLGILSATALSFIRRRSGGELIDSLRAGWQAGMNIFRRDEES